MFAPMSLLTYDEVRPWARAIKQRVSRREMPPWHADSAPGVFKNDPRLAQKDIDTIAAWVDGGAPLGNAKDLPPAPNYNDGGWTIGTPDLVLTMPEEYHIPADGLVPYLNFRIPTGLTEDKWIQAYEFRPSNRGIVHHIVASAVPANSQPNAVDEAGGGRNSIGNLVPSRPGVVLPQGVAKLLPANSEIVLRCTTRPTARRRATARASVSSSRNSRRSRSWAAVAAAPTTRSSFRQARPTTKSARSGSCPRTPRSWR
jgi:hypothetical protein